MKYILVLLSLLLSACTQRGEVVSQRWNNEGVSPGIPSFVDMNKNIQLRLGHEVVEYQKQTLEDIEISGAYLKVLRANGDAVTYMNYSLRSSLPSRVLRAKKRMLKHRAEVTGQLEARHPAIFAEAVSILAPKFFLTEDNQLLWNIEYADLQSQSFSAFFNEDLEFVRTSRLSSNFENHDVIGNVFPLGPLKSTPQNVRLRNLDKQKYLQSKNLKVITKSDQQATSENGQFIYESNDDRFKQVQVYFDLSESLAWFAKNFQFQTPRLLTVETSVGHPQKTSAAFYHNSKISLGDGDGEAFKEMALDPSVTKHEFVHFIIDNVSGLVNEGESASLNEAFADYFTATQRNNPKMAEASYLKADAKRSLANSFRVSEKNGGIYHDSLIISGLLWQMRTDLQPAVVDLLVWNTLKRLHPFAGYFDFVQELKAEMESLTPEQKSQISTIMEERGFDVH